MKGLLRKDCFMALKYCRSLLLCCVAFLIGFYFNPENTFFAFYPCIFPTMIPISLLGYDERNRWEAYSDGLPCTRRQMVTSKYLVGACAQAASLVLSALFYSAALAKAGSFRFAALGSFLCLLIICSCLASFIGLPFMFKLGVEKGRIVYYILVGAVSAGSVLLSSGLSAGFSLPGLSGWLLPAGAVLSVGLYVLSWALSCRFYENREF